MWLPDQVFKTVIQSTPLISIDLVVRNEKNEVLLGKRLNAPAKDYWFVPGGRIQKDESLDKAFKRLLLEELDISLSYSREDANFIGVFEHFYNENFYDSSSSTHYVVLAFVLKINSLNISLVNNCQHRDYLWVSKEQSILLDNVHDYSRVYLDKVFL
ncbi:GDP-mannose mannosyl hydrolase [Acinetobacter soli]|uniref:GDP-mannose mannosyl hydrolase n=1 Tax=Acinetobacter soli TaxID=487316 RepID=UPI00125DF582|nr:GDP-mannose mannosyl hydrolase [Acinetobacter soli]MCF3128338.1 GDP-mannose mannosyl hydrolase [Acinetobacter soli]